MSIGRTIAGIPILGSMAAFAYRCLIATREGFRHSITLARWLMHSRETTNFTYDLSPLNKAYLASVVADATGASHDEAARYITELESDEALTQHILTTAPTRSDQRGVDRRVYFGRRLGWYAIARIIKPKTIVETGVDKGLGSCVLTAALAKNAAEGHPGRYYGLDINPKAGYLLAGPLAQFGEIRYGDALQSLRALDAAIDLFINDSDHSADYESEEYRTIEPRLAPGAFVLGDNAHYTDRLLRFAQATGRDFLFFRETPVEHWYPGAGIGIAFTRSARPAAARNDRRAHR